MSKHTNSGDCSKCDELFDLYPNFHAGLRNWFKAFQKSNPDGHISCAGRGKDAQEAAFKAGTSKAHYGQSSHNVNAAIDVFRLTVQQGASWDPTWFRNNIQTAVIDHNIDPKRSFSINWYGSPMAKFRELPHLEVDNWHELVKNNELQLTEKLIENSKDLTVTP